jgi:hypothetical protein
MKSDRCRDSADPASDNANIFFVSHAVNRSWT